MVVHTCKPSTQEVIQDQPELQRDTVSTTKQK
jgi:hypothetical protein